MSCRVFIPLSSTPLHTPKPPQHAGLPVLHNTITTATAAAGTSFPPRSACSAYESFNAAVGLLGIYNDAILSEQPGQQQQDAANWAFWLAAVEQVCAGTPHVSLYALLNRTVRNCDPSFDSATESPHCTKLAFCSRRTTGLVARVRQTYRSGMQHLLR